MTAEFETELIECLSALEAGESVDQVLTNFPADAPELRPILTVAAALPAFKMSPSEAQKIAARAAFLKQAAQLHKPTAQRRFFFGAMRHMAATVTALALILVVLSGGAVAASGSALPGDPLYGLKRSVENVRLALTNGAAHADLENDFEQARVREANALLDAGREAEVEFHGPINSIQDNGWIVAGLVVHVVTDTQVVGVPQIDRLAQVRGLTTSDGLVARTISVEPGDEASPTPTPSPSPLPTLAPTATPTAVPTLEPTEPRPTRAPQPTWTPVPPTQVPTAEPTQVPAEIDFTGTVESQGDSWSISGVVVAVTTNTEIKGNIGLGQRVQVKALRFADGRLLALSIELREDSGNPPPNDNQNHNGNHNENQNSNDNRNENRNGNANHNENGNENDNRNSNHNGGD